MGLADSPGGPACPSRASSWVTHPPPGVSRVAFILRMQTCRRHYPGGIVAGIELLPGQRRQRPSPNVRGVGSRINPFEACSAFTQVTACLLAGLPVQPFPSEASAVSLPPLPLRLLLAGATVARWELHPLKNDTFARRTAHSRLLRQAWSSFALPLVPLPTLCDHPLLPFWYLLASCPVLASIMPASMRDCQTSSSLMAWMLSTT